MHFIWVSLYRVLIGDTIFTSPTGDGTAILCGLPHEGLAVCRAKGVPSFLSYFKTLSIGPARKTVPPTSRSAVKRSADWATCNPALSRSTCTVLKGWLCITCEEVLAILLWGHFQMRKIYLGGRGSSDKKTSISHLCSNFSHLTESLSHNSINWRILKINYLKKLDPN